ncbi:DNA helicase RecQ [Alphaproteobacteria bacterium]|nr:DNA helicase RecQ [Alphaproteobacteria bacterium]
MIPNQDKKNLKNIFGFDKYKNNQEEIIKELLAGKDILTVMPTGGGKSLCYQLPATLFDGLTIVVSPLIALMQSQVAQLKLLGIKAYCLNSSNSDAENKETMEMLESNEIKLLYVAPERLIKNETIDLLKTKKISLLAIDEAHCVSQWGHDFRKEYLKLGEVRKELSMVQTIALTATADETTRRDIIDKIFPKRPSIFIAGFDRPNIYLSMLPKNKAKEQILSFIKPLKGQTGIIYCSTRKKTEEWSKYLKDHSFNALPYHAGMTVNDRKENLEAFIQEEGIVITATIAFGLGIDKPNVRFVCHANMPGNIESYYQEIGRAGRDGLPSFNLTVYGLDDISLRTRQINDQDSTEEKKRLEKQRLNQLIALCEATRCRRQALLSYFGEVINTCGNCDICKNGIELIDGTEEAQKILSAIIRTGERFGVTHIVDILIGNQTENIKKFSHDKLKTFNIGSDLDKSTWQSIIRQLFSSGHINIDIENYGALKILKSGNDILFNANKFQRRKEVLSPKLNTVRNNITLSDINEDDETLFNKLKELRFEYAKKLKLPAYVIFPDKTLIEMAKYKPKNDEELEKIFGVGKAKLKKFGKHFIGAIISN